MGTYAEHRDKLKSGDAVFFREHGFFPRLIRRATMSDYCHCGVVVRFGSRVFVLEARQSQGVTMRLLSEALPCDWIATGCNWSEDVETSALMKLQTHYSLAAAIALGLGLQPPGQTQACSLFLRGAIQPGLPGFVIEEKGCTPGNVAETLMSMGLPSLTLN